MSAFVVGLTGGIASGKSELARHFQSLGASLIDADLVAREIATQGPVLARIAQRFGAQMILPDGTLDRRALRTRVFADPLERQALEAITHPPIRAALYRAAQAAPADYALVTIPLLAEAGGRQAYPWLDRIVLVDAPVTLQHARLMRRDGIDTTLAGHMIQAQATRAQRLALADDVVRNDGDPAALHAQVHALDTHYRALAAAKRARPTL